MRLGVEFEAHRFADAGASGGSPVCLNVLVCYYLMLFHECKEPKCFLVCLSNCTKMYVVYIACLVKPANVMLSLVSLRCMELLYRQAVNACSSLYILYYRFLCSL